MNLIGAMRAQYSRSKQLSYLWALPISLGVYLVALITALPLPEKIAGILAIVMFLFQIAAFVLRVMASDHYDLAEGIRRAVMLQDGLGIPPSPAQLAKLQERTVNATSAEATLDRAYYDSDEETGPRRLLDIISQASFFTSALARRMWKLFATIATIGLVGPILLILTAISIHTSEPALAVAARVVIASMAFWAVGDIVVMAVQFFQLSLEAGRSHNVCESALRQSSPEVTDALLVFAEYNCAVVKAPAIPFRIYSRRRFRLNLAWNERKAALRTATNGSGANRIANASA